jgi:hypothetical protein
MIAPAAQDPPLGGGLSEFPPGQMAEVFKEHDHEA